ncbi:MAG: hypothetical protein N4A41_02895 [Crocinitomicaceae bacterium]|jgi:hypothetical protein|nr:hypothetical protein [Crocinitomicaceae bacterium]
MERICSNGHRYEKTSDCPVCPRCEQLLWVGSQWVGLANPAKRALAAHGVEDYSDFIKYTREEVASWHGIGPNALKKIEEKLKECHLSWGK